MSNASPIFFLDSDAQLEPEGDVMLLSLLSGEQTFIFAMPRHRARRLAETGIRTMDKLDRAEGTIRAFRRPQQELA